MAVSPMKTCVFLRSREQAKTCRNSSQTTSATTDEIPEKKRYETTVILIDDCAVPTTTSKLKKWTDDFTDAQNWLLRQLGAFPGDRYFAAIFDHKEKRSVFKEKGR
jgi:hypothetical protein